MKKILLSAFACDPSKGSEPSNGWNWAIGLAKSNYEVHCFTRSIGKAAIEKYDTPVNLSFHYINLPFGGEKLYFSSNVGMYMYYVLWQWYAYKKACELHIVHKFDLTHHVTWGSTQMGSFMYKLNIPFIFGPAGGGQAAPIAFKAYFMSHWSSELKRERISRWMLKYNPACKQMLQKAYAVVVSNPDTESMVKNIGASNVLTTLDAALPDSFFPNGFIEKKRIKGRIKLLWVGRFMPRKGLLLLLDVMKELKDYPNITLTVVGDGEIRNAFLEKLKEDNIQNTVDWKGMVPYEEVKAFYTSHDIFTFTSLRDSCPAQLIEAMAYSMPVITLNLHGQAIIVNDATGFRCDCSTPELAIKNLKEAILFFYNNPDSINNKSKAAYMFARQQTWSEKIKYLTKNSYPPACLN